MGPILPLKKTEKAGLLIISFLTSAVNKRGITGSKPR